MGASRYGIGSMVRVTDLQGNPLVSPSGVMYGVALREKIIHGVRDALNNGEYTNAGLQDAFFRWPEIVRALDDSLEKILP